MLYPLDPNSLLLEGRLQLLSKAIFQPHVFLTVFPSMKWEMEHNTLQNSALHSSE